jgi:hypothetical protein
VSTSAGREATRSVSTLGFFFFNNYFGDLFSAYPALPGGSRRRQATTMSAHVLLPLAVNSKSEQRVDSLPPLRFEPAIIGMLAHLSDRSAKSHPNTKDEMIN